MNLHADVCVVGGGPAGAACALRLAQLGHAVVLVERGPPGRPHVGESLPASVLPVLDQLGVRQAVESAGFLRPRGALVRWDGPLHTMDEPRAGDAGFQVDRARFDALLLGAASAAGVRVLQPATAGAPMVGPQGVSLPLHDGRMVLAQTLVLAHGRRGGEPTAPRTAALFARWHRLPAHTDPRMRVEAADHAWYWGAPLPDGCVNTAVFVDASRCAGLAPSAREALYRRLLGESSLLSACLQGEAAGPVQVCDATPRLARDIADARVFKVGEAAFSIDPLSSQGVQAALRSALHAAACLHTLVHRPHHQALALQFHRDQVQRAAARHAQLAAGFHRAAALARGTAFWQARAAAASPADARTTTPQALPALDSWVGLDTRLRWQRMPTLQGDFIVEADALVHPALDGPVSFIGGASMAALLRPLAQPLPLCALLKAWCAEAGEAAAVQWLTALWRQGVVVAAPAH
ncbi:flavin-dependent monooxygenase QhpG [Ideonella sp. BN130291]|uniref:flavin-dependent monooxygenase QhpG n=1 Tax=Ideonella sp. BN130291 TaxID=3112940 RepID=UPI002E254A26|nr:FAD-dependent oxidoreductase [Ideonella sp. BN130291]